MASGWSTGVATGLLADVNTNIATAKKQQQELNQQGMEAQLQSFKEAAKEYDDEKRDVSERTSRMQANASLIAGGVPDDNAMALAYQFDQTSNGKTELKGEQLKQAQNDFSYMKNNPQAVQQNKGSSASTDDSQPNIPPNINPNVLSRFGVSQDQLNSIYGPRPNVQAPNNLAPASQPLAQQQTQDIQNRIQAETLGKLNAETSPQAIQAQQQAAAAKSSAQASGQAAAAGYNVDNMGNMHPIQGATPPQQPTPQPQAGATPQATPSGAPTNPLAMNASALQPPAQGGGSPQAPQQPPASGPPQPQPGTAQPVQGGVPATPSTPPSTPAGLSQDQQDTKDKVDYLKSIVQSGQEPVPPSSNDNFLKPDGPWDTRNYGALNNLTRDDAVLAKAMSNGDRAVTPYMATRGDAVVKHITKTLQDFDNTFTENRIGGKKDFMYGNDASTINNMNTALGHMGLLNEAGKAVAQSNLPVLNKIANVYGVQSGSSPAVVYDNISHYVASELRRVYGGKNSGLAELSEIAKGIDTNQSPEQRQDVLHTMAQMLSSKMNSYDYQYQGIMGNAYKPQGFLAPHAASVYNELMQPSQQATQGTGGPDFSHLWSSPSGGQ